MQCQLLMRIVLDSMKREQAHTVGKSRRVNKAVEKA